MNKFKSLDFYDFTYNGKKLSTFGGYVGSADGGLKQYSLLPSRSYTTDKPLNSDITTVFASSLEPRVFEVPIVFEQLGDSKLRQIAHWLDSPIPQPFQWDGDDVYINACLDSTDFLLDSSSGEDGQIVLKFICFDPFYYSVNETQYTQSTMTSGTAYSFDNNSHVEVYPVIQITCNGDITLEILDSEDNVYTTTNITEITGGVTINTETRTCTLLSGASHYAHIDAFPIIPPDSPTFKVKVTGTVLNNMTITFREKYL